MRRALLVAAAVLALPAVAAAPSGAWVFVGETVSGEVVVLDGADHYTSCGGIAPVATQCSSSHPGWTSGLGHGFIVNCVPTELPIELQRDSCFGGRLQSTLTPAGRTFTCDWLPGVYPNAANPHCAGSGDWPPPETPFTQQCTASAWLGLPAPPAVGTWRCYVGDF
ncbi:MAG TPA: hypothetical protein VGR28_01365 [Candidatus Thermoplasmatota archaeon]|jgi:hypothetical protein|nr:hypothetical protein [Candidatus Thermoplasmatota archaeon]